MAGLTGLVVLSACSLRPGSESSEQQTLAEAREGFSTNLVTDTNAYYEVEQPPAGVFDVVTYPSDVGDLAAYLTPDPGDGEKHPAIVWITGGDNNTIADVWTPATADNDQTAAQYRDVGIVMMFPSQRGGNLNPGQKEAFLGEADDIIAAAEYVAALPYVDPNRVFLGGHSTGGTMVLLTAELPNPFRAVFSFGPVADPAESHNPEWMSFDTTDAEEARLRAPGRWLDSVQTPTWVIEGGDEPSNAYDVDQMASDTTNPNLHFVVADGYDHFSVLEPINTQIAQAIVDDTGDGTFSLALS